MEGREHDAEREDLRVGELAVELALVSRKHYMRCLDEKQALRQNPDLPDKSLTQILVDAQLLTAEQVENLRERVRQQERAQAASKKPSRKEAAPKKTRPQPAPAAKPPRSHLREIVVAACVAAVFILVWVLWPDVGAQHTLTAYLKSCGEGQTPDRSRVIRDLGLVVRSFEVEKALPAQRHDYSTELRAFGGPRGPAADWEAFLRVAGMPQDKEKALRLALPGLPGNITPQSVRSLTVTVRPIRCRLNYRPRAQRLFVKSAPCEFQMVKVSTPKWSARWKVAAFRRLPGG